MDKAAVIVFPGSNCDHDAYNVLKNFNIQVDFVWHKDSDLSDYDFILIPGGFSYGDYLRAGAIARVSPIMQSVYEEASKGKIILGICNGFQILIESGLLPGSLITNKTVRFLSQEITLNVETSNSPFSNKLKTNTKLKMPIAHKQGNYFADEELVKKLQDEDRIVFTYFPDNSRGNPNGSLNSIAGILNKDRNVLGMMPHPERASENILCSSDGKKIFESFLN